MMPGLTLQPFPPVQFEWHLKIWTKSPLWCGTHQRQGNHSGLSLPFFSIIVQGNFERSCTFTALGLEQRHFWGETNSYKRCLPLFQHSTITDLMLVAVCFAGFPEKNFKSIFFFFICMLEACIQQIYRPCLCLFFQFSDFEACSSLLSFGAGQPYSVPGQSLPPTSYFRQRFVRNS